MPDPRDACPEYVIRRLDEAGATLMAIPARGIFPSGIRSSMPDYIHLPDKHSHRTNPLYSASEAPRPRPPVPSSRAVQDMEEVYFRWVSLLPWRTWFQQRDRRILLLRSLVWPLSEREDPHVWSWRALGDEFGMSDKTVTAHHDRTVDELVRKLRRLPDSCSATLARIADHKIPHSQFRFRTSASTEV